MAASSTTSKSKSTPVPTPTPVASRSNGTSVQVLVKASPSVAPEDESTIKVAPKKEKGINGVTGTIKLKKPVPKHNKPGNWREGSVVDREYTWAETVCLALVGLPELCWADHDAEEKKKGTDTPSTTTSVPTSPGPVVNQLDDNARDAFATGRPLEDGLDSRVCKHCKKTVLKTALKAHLTACLKAKKDKALRKKEQKEARERERRAVENDGKDDDGDTNMGEDDDDEKGHGIKTAKKSAGKKLDLEKGKKRKLDVDAEKGPKSKKKKEDVKVKTGKPKGKNTSVMRMQILGLLCAKKLRRSRWLTFCPGPVDVEKQCGVLKDGVPCARSLTCKSHSMGAKRAVPGRSLPYDMLLAAYQKKNQAKQQSKFAFVHLSERK